MARRRRYRRYRRRSGKWSPNIVKISSRNTASTGEFFNQEFLAENTTSNSSGVAQVFTVKNFEITFTIEHSAFDSITAPNDLESITAYIMYVPQGMNVTSAYYAEHPEYIMAYKYLGSPATAINQVVAGSNVPLENQQYQPYRIRTRMSRKLNTGDKVILYVQGSNQDSNSRYYNIDGLVRWWSKAN